MNLDEWNEHWNGHWQQYLRNKNLLVRTKFIRKYLKGKIADIGCGVTDMYRNGDDITGVDISEECIKIMKERHPLGIWLVGDAVNTGLPSSSFDTVVCSDVLEHFLDQREIVEELKRIVKPDGNIVIVVPRLSVGRDHVHPKWYPGKIEDRITAYLDRPKYELVSRNHWVIQGGKTTTVSVVMIAWSPRVHRLKVMVQSVKSLKSCTRYPFKWIVVDNGPSEQTDFIKAMEPDVHIINKVNQGPPVSRNIGAGVCDTDYIVFVDNDMLFCENWLTDSIGLLERYPDKKLIAVPTDCRVMRRADNYIADLDDCVLTRFGGSGCWVMRRRTFEEVGKWSRSFPNDVDYAARAVSFGYSFIHRKDGPVVKHLAWHRRTFNAGEHFVDGHWIPDKGDKRSRAAAKRLLLDTYARRFGTKVFVETGTGYGDTIKTMLVTGLFNEIYSVEINEGLYGKITRRFRSFSHIHCDLGDSAVWLPEILKKIKEPALFWIDDNVKYKYAQQAGSPVTIVDKIKAIINHRQDHVILIDNASYYDNDLPDYPNLEQLKELFSSDWVFENIEDVIRVYRNAKTR